MLVTCITLLAQKADYREKKKDFLPTGIRMWEQM
jgi:hypothetical protein